MEQGSNIHASDTDVYHVEEQIGFVLRRAHQRASSIFQSFFSDFQITPTQFSAMCKLKDEGEISQNHLGRLTAMDPATIQGVTRRLIERGLVETRADEVDKRRMQLRLTTEGEDLIDKLIEKGRAVTSKTLSPLSDVERVQLLGLLEKIS
ncbi:MarR family winged helix-turn-helix transcriptional regulator [Sneathiella glossodoripedis]|uniref:MarR family winged helix-turn-helix transcriptional regulator n=1 Tax=Sneathiella glossodoripedis TaxID=418853 RepID=UPI000471A26F|nr:MarR family transcriptional regulator [Sneathiella glossodoripedis]